MDYETGKTLERHQAEIQRLWEYLKGKYPDDFEDDKDDEKD